MSIFKCKMCGGTIEFNPGDSVGICDSCGTKQTLPRLDDDRRANLYDRANHFRRNNEFDKAAGIYERILNEDTSDAEAYWSLVLCRYGIEYVEDPTTHKRVPTVNRAQFTSIFDDDNYKSALQYADGYQRAIYESEANTINEIQKGILAISQKEEPFDVFICYKETDAGGRRTQDSVLANDLYHQLTNEGFKVFFSRITLEDKLGTAYEPYIFAALNSAKVMVVLGTKPEYFNAVWVKNEWSRYLSLVKQSGGKKVLIPAYRDMDPYDLPDEFSHLQAQDMSKLGFMQDLIRGIKKIVKADTPKATSRETVVVSPGNANAAPLLRRAYMFLEDGDWAKADEFCEQVLNLEPENAQAYLGKLMAELNVRQQEELPNCKLPFDKSNNFQKAVRFGGEKLSATLKGYITHINERNENARLTNIYNGAVNAMNSAGTEAAYKAAAANFKTISEFKDSNSLFEQCLEQAEICRKNAIYANARSQMTGEKVDGYIAAIKIFHTISGWKDADEQITACKLKVEEIKAREEAERLEREHKSEQARIAAEKAARKRKRTVAIVAIIITTIIVASISLVIIRARKIASSEYERAVTLIDSGDYEAAFRVLKGLNYKDSVEKLESIKPQYTNILSSKAQVGNYIVFGSYEQDNNTSNGKEDIEWLVLARKDDQVLVISRYALDCQQYHSSKGSVTWATCSLRTWLKANFINSAFSSVEQAMISDTTVTADANPYYDTSPGDNTTDKVFLLSVMEATRYLRSNSARQCQATEFAKEQGASVNSKSGNCSWWLRSPGKRSTLAITIQPDGFADYSGIDPKWDNVAVRPAMWIDFGS